MHYIEQVWGGLVLGEREENRCHDSYFHVLAWDGEIGAPREIMYASTAFGNADNCGPLQPDTIARIVALTPAHIWDLYAKHQQRAYAAAQVLLLGTYDCRQDIGATVKVTRGRKVPKGTIGRIMTIRRETVHRAYSEWATKRRDMAMIHTGHDYPIVDLANCDLIAPSAHRAQLLFDLAN